MAGWRLFLFGLLAGLIAAAVTLIVARGCPARPVELLPPTDPPGVQVFVSGAVRATGVCQLPAGSLVRDALQAASGALPQADLESLNLAEQLSAGDEIRSRFRATAVPPLQPGQLPAATAPLPNHLLRINAANLAELDTLPGIGPRWHSASSTSVRHTGRVPAWRTCCACPGSDRPSSRRSATW